MSTRKIPIRAIIFGRNQLNSVSDNQLYPFLLYKSELIERFNFFFTIETPDSLSDIDVEVANRYDIVFVQRKISKDYDSQFLDIFKKINTKKVFLDDTDSADSYKHKVANHVDLYLKKQALLQPAAELTPKLYIGWNIGTAKHLIKILQKHFLFRFLDLGTKKGIDLSFRGYFVHQSSTSEHQYAIHRNLAKDAMHRLASKYNVVVTDNWISFSKYFKELRRSKICLSPWGYGEICYRDFEAILAGALLVKPSMEHLTTQPNVYIPGETYVPVASDFSDLERVCAYYLEHEDERLTITKRALEVYQSYFDKKVFVDQIGEILKRLSYDV